MTFDAPRVARELEPKSAEEVLRWALDRWHPRIALARSGAGDGAVVDLVLTLRPDARIFLLDTGRLNQETYQLVDRVRERYGHSIEVMFPDTAAVERMVRAKGMNLFYESIENRKE